MFKFYNPHPENKLVRDCVKRAFTKATGKTYQEVSSDLNRIKRAQGASAYNVNSVWKSYVEEELKADKLSFPAVKGESRMNGERFCESHPVGTYILNMAGHLACCVDGIIYDTWDCSEKCVYTAYSLTAAATDTKEVETTHDDIIHTDAEPDTHPDIPTDGLVSIRGNDIVARIAELVGTEVLKTKEGESWIKLDEDSLKETLRTLHKTSEYSHFVWKTRGGSSRTKIMDESTGMTLVLRTQPYGSWLWCTKD